VSLVKVTILITVLIATTALLGSSFLVSVTPLLSDQPFQFQNQAGSRTSSIGYTVISNTGSDSTIVVLGGWLFKPSGEEETLETSLEIYSENDSYSKKLTLVREGMYYTLKPLLVSYPSGYSLKVMGIEAMISADGGEDMTVMNYLLVDLVAKDRLSAGIEIGLEKEGKFVETPLTGIEPVVIIKAGSKPTGGYQLSIQNVKLSGDQIQVQAKLKSPGKNDYVTQAFTYPFIAFRLLDLSVGEYKILINMDVEVDSSIVKTEQFSGTFYVY
jgi:hypothetical protein